jgi:hypothetical protein
VADTKTSGHGELFQLDPKAEATNFEDGEQVKIAKVLQPNRTLFWKPSNMAYTLQT